MGLVIIEYYIQYVYVCESVNNKFNSRFCNDLNGGEMRR